MPPKPKARSFTDWTRDSEELIAEIETIESQSAAARDPKRIADTLTLVGALCQRVYPCRIFVQKVSSKTWFTPRGDHHNAHCATCLTKR